MSFVLSVQTVIQYTNNNTLLVTHSVMYSKHKKLSSFKYSLMANCYLIETRIDNW